MVKSRTNKIPGWIIDLVNQLLESEIRERTGIKISQLNPVDFVSYIKTPVYQIIGNQDELVSHSEFFDMFRKFRSKIKQMKIFIGNHTEERPEFLVDNILKFIS